MCVILSSLYLILVITRPTRITENSATLIDNISISNCDQCLSAGCVASDISDHFSVFLICKTILNTDNIVAGNVVSYRLINDHSLSKMDMELKNSNLDELCGTESVSDAILCLNNLIVSCFNRNCPLVNRTVSYKNYTKPWLNGLVGRLRNRRHQYLLYRTGRISRQQYARLNGGWSVKES